MITNHIAIACALFSDNIYVVKKAIGRKAMNNLLQPHSLKQIEPIPSVASW